MITALMAALWVSAAAPPPLAVRSMIRKAKGLVVEYGEPLWPGFGKAPFQVDYIEPEREVLFCRRRQAGFEPLGPDPVTGCGMQVRSRQLDRDLAASADFLPGGSVIAIGTPETLVKKPADWVITLVHEDFHQYQSKMPGYRAAVEQLGLLRAAGISWMLDYPFPYADSKVADAFSAMTAQARAFLSASSPLEQREAITFYLKDRRAAQILVGPTDWRYYEFQVGQEGVARWTEMAVAKAAGGHDKAMADAAVERQRSLSVSLDAIDRQGLKVWRRSIFYVLGPVEVEMLEALRHPWRDEYRRAPFSVGDQLARAMGQTNAAEMVAP